jgi:hypothetical protein
VRRLLAALATTPVSGPTRWWSWPLISPSRTRLRQGWSVGLPSTRWTVGHPRRGRPRRLPGGRRRRRRRAAGRAGAGRAAGARGRAPGKTHPRSARRGRRPRPRREQAPKGAAAYEASHWATASTRRSSRWSSESAARRAPSACRTPASSRATRSNPATRRRGRHRAPAADLSPALGRHADPGAGGPLHPALPLPGRARRASARPAPHRAIPWSRPPRPAAEARRERPAAPRDRRAARATRTNSGPPRTLPRGRHPGRPR